MFKYVDYQKDKDRVIVASNEETISILTHKVIKIIGATYSCMGTYNHEEELCKSKKNLMKFSEELLYINSRNTNRINEIANEIYSIEELFSN